MKCQHCGSNLNIEDNFCQFCGQPNPFAVQHQREMEQFTHDYIETKEEVIKETEGKSRRAGKITVLAVLFALVCIMLILVIKADDISYWRQDKKIADNKAKYEAVVREYMSEEDVLGLAYYAQENRITWNDSFREYDKMFSVASDYRRLYEYCAELRQLDYLEYKNYSKTEIIESISEYLQMMFEDYKREQYDKDEEFSDGKLEFMDATLAQAKLLVRTVFGISAEEADSLETMTEARINVLLEDSYEKKTQK